MADSTEPALPRAASELRVVLGTIFARDAELTRACLADAGISCDSAATDDALMALLDEGAGVVVVAAERLTRGLVPRLQAHLAAQPAWSDLPLIVLVSATHRVDLTLETLHALGNVTTVERPLRRRALESVVRSALRARERQYEARALLEQLSDADKRKDAFIAILGHELRNPLAAIHAAAGLLEMVPQKDARLTRIGDVVGRQVSNLQRLVDDLLDVARVTAGKIVLERQRLDVRTIVRQMATMLEDQAREHRHRVDIVVPPEEVIVDADPVRLEQMLGNLLHNAIKYTPDGGHIRIVVEPAAESVKIRVIDNGRGLPRESLQRVFEPFAQVESSLHRSAGGLGLGLPLVRGLATLHGGTVEAHSEGLGTGSEFAVSLPLAEKVEQRVDVRRRVQPAGPHEGLRVLLVDDFVDTLDVLRIGLEQLGCEVHTATDGRAAIERATGAPYDVAFLDIGLPEVDGFEVARALRAAPRTKELPLIAMSGYGREEDKRRSLEAGFDAHLVKPVDQRRLLAAFEHVRSARTST